MHSLQQPDDAGSQACTRTAFLVDGLYVRNCSPIGPARGVVLFVHGATIGSVLFDIPVAGYSLLELCASNGWDSFALDLTGYAQSQRPAAMDDEPADCPVICSGSEALANVDRVVRHVLAATGSANLVLVGGSWGSVTVARYAIAQPGLVSRLALLAPLFAAINPAWLRTLANPLAPEVINPGLGGYRYVTSADVLARWDAEIEPGQADQRRDSRVVQALLDAEMKADPRSAVRGGFRSPNGTLHDLFEVFSGRPLYEPARLTTPCLLVRGQHDQTSTAADLDGLYAQIASPHKTRALIAGGGHFMQAERCAPLLHDCLLTFLNARW